MWSIAPEQSTSMFFRILPVESPQEKNENIQLYQTSFNLSASTANPKMMDVEDIQAPYFDFLERERIFLTEKKKLETNVLSNDNNGNGTDQSELDLIIMWETALETGSTESIILIGQQNICKVSFLSPTTVDKSVAANNSLRFTIESPRKVIHDFNEQG